MPTTPDRSRLIGEPYLDGIPRTRPEKVPDALIGTAKVVFDRIEEMIEAYQGNLAEGEELAIRLAHYGALRVRRVRCQRQHLIIFDGLTEDGHEASVVQHPSQVNMMLVTMPAAVAPPRIIFEPN